MPILSYGKPTKDNLVHQRANIPAKDDNETIPLRSLSQNNILHLQRMIGNQGVQRLLAEEKRAATETRQSGHTTGLPILRGINQPKVQPDIQRCSCGGKCAKCQAAHAEEEPITIPQLQHNAINAKHSGCFAVPAWRARGVSRDRQR